MKAKQKTKLLLVALLAVSMILSFAACSGCNKSSVEWLLSSGAAMPESITAEYGVLCNIPEVTVSDSKTSYEVTVTVTTTEGAEVKTSNHKFRVNDMGGYVISYHAVGGKLDETRTIRVEVEDTTPPRISTVSAESGMAMIIGEEFTVPPHTVSEASDSTLKATVTVEDPTGAAVSLTEGKFTPTVSGMYKIRYAATDKNGNSATETLTVKSAKGKNLNRFDSVEAGQGVTALSREAWTKEVVSENIISADGGVRVSMNKDDSTWSFVRIAITQDGTPLTLKEILQFEKLQLYVYATYDAQLFMANQAGSVTLKVGMNIINFSHEDIVTACESAAQYNEGTGSFYVQIRNSPADQYLIFDELLGIYADDYQPPKSKITIQSVDGFVAKRDEAYKIPTATAIKIEDESALKYSVKVTAPDGTDLPIAADTFTPTAYGTYTVTYFVDDAEYAGEEETITVVCGNAVLLNDFSADDGSGIGSLGRQKWSRGFVTENAMSDDGAAALYTNGDASSWTGLRITLGIDGAPIEWKDLRRFESVQMYVYSSYTTTVNLCSRYGEQTLKNGINRITFTKADIAAAYEASINNKVKQFVDSTFYFEIRNTYDGQEDVIVFDNLYGVYADDYQPPVYTSKIDGISGMVIAKGVPFTVPAYQAKDTDEQTLDFAVSVKDATGKAYEVTDNAFTPDAFGAYTIVYTLTEGNYAGEYDEITVHCLNAVVCNEFDTESAVDKHTATAGTLSVVTDNMISGNGVKLLAENGDIGWKGVKLVVSTNEAFTWNDLRKFEQIKLYVYASASTRVHLSGQKGEVTLSPGMNIVSFNKSAITAAYNNSSTQFADGKFYLEIRSLAKDEYLVFDSLIGIYPDEYSAPATDDIVFDIKGASGMVLPYDSVVSVPAATATKNGAAVDVTVAVKAPDGSDVTVSGGTFKVEQLGEYTLTYAVYDGSDRLGYQEIKAFGEKAMLLNGFDTVGGITEKGRAAWTLATTDEYAISEKGLALFTNGDASNWSYMRLAATVNERPLTDEELAKFDKVQFYLYSTYATIVNLFGETGEMQIQPGVNVVTFTKEQLAVAMKEGAQVHATSGSFYLGLRSTPAGQLEQLVFDGFYGIYARDYQMPIDYTADFEVESGEPTAVLGTEYTVPTATVTNVDGEPLAYEVTVHDPDGTLVQVTGGGTFVIEKAGMYTIRYTVTTENYTDNVHEITVTGLAGTVLNDFSNVTKIIAMERAAWTKEAHADGVKVNVDTNGWQRIWVAMQKDGAAIRWADLQKYEEIQIHLYSSVATAIYTAGRADYRVSVAVGDNVIVFKMADIIASYEYGQANNNAQYNENTGSFNLAVAALPAKGELIFKQIIGVYPEGYVEPVKREVTLNAFTEVTDISTANCGNWTKAVISESTDGTGVRVNITDNKTWNAIHIKLTLNGNPISYQELCTMDEIRITVYTDHAVRLYMYNYGGDRTLAVGENVLIYKISDMIASHEAATAAGAYQYDESTGLFRIGFATPKNGGHWIFRQAIGVHPESET